jgi:hypothetical protein
LFPFLQAYSVILYSAGILKHSHGPPPTTPTTNANISINNKVNNQPKVAKTGNTQSSDMRSTLRTLRQADVASLKKENAETAALLAKGQLVATKAKTAAVKKKPKKVVKKKVQKP